MVESRKYEVRALNFRLGTFDFRLSFVLCSQYAKSTAIGKYYLCQ